jgi:transcriptional regulator with XRE-family HTH domain
LLLSLTRCVIMNYKLMTQHLPIPELTDIGRRIAALRKQRGLTKAELAARSGLKSPQIVYFESGQRTPDLGHLLRLARALEAPLQRFLTGTDRPGAEWPDLALELRRLGLVDLWVAGALVPGAFRHPEEVAAACLATDSPEARVVEGLPALLSWNRWNPTLLRAFAKVAGRPVARRLAWLADVALTIDKQGGMPGGCVGRKDLTRFVDLIKVPPRDAAWDGLGRPTAGAPTSPVWRRWRISYPATLETFRERAARLAADHQAEGRPLPGE